MLCPEAENRQKHRFQRALNLILQPLTPEQQSEYLPSLLEYAEEVLATPHRLNTHGLDIHRLLLPSLSSQVVNQIENACYLHGCVCKLWLKVHCIKCNLKTRRQVRQEHNLAVVRGKKQKFRPINLICNNWFHILNTITLRVALALALAKFLGRNSGGYQSFLHDASLIEVYKQRLLLWVQFNLALIAIVNQIVLESKILATECGVGIAIPQIHHFRDFEWNQAKAIWAKHRRD